MWLVLPPPLLLLLLLLLVLLVLLLVVVFVGMELIAGGRFIGSHKLSHRTLVVAPTLALARALSIPTI